MGYSRSSARTPALAAARRAVAERGDAVCGAGLHQQRAADTRREPDRPIERHLERRARAHLVAPARARDLGVGLLGAVHREDRARARLSDHRHQMRPAPCHRPLRIAHAVCGRAQQMTCADAAGQPRQHCYTVDRRRQRDHRRDAPVLGGDAHNVTAGVRNAPQHNAFRVDARQLSGSGDARRGNPGAGVGPTPAGAATRPTRRTRGSRTTPRLIRRRRSRAHSPSRRWCPECPRIPVPSPRTALRAHRRTHRHSRRNAKRRNGRGHW